MRHRARRPRGTVVGEVDTAIGDAPLLQVRALRIESTTNGQEPIVDDVSFAVFPRERYGLVGSSGSGKSTTARAIVDLLPPGLERTAGQIVFDGRELTGRAPSDWARLRGAGIATIPQDARRALVPVVSVGKQASVVYRRHHDCDDKTAHEAVLDMFLRVHLPDPARAARAYPHELSGGMAQRVAIAMALLAEPRLIIADEPTTGLDVMLQFAVLELLCELMEKADMSLLLISHDLAVIANYTTSLAMMHNGCIIESGATREVFESPKDEYTKSLLAAVELDSAGSV